MKALLSLLFVLSCNFTLFAGHDIKFIYGSVTFESGEPAIGVSIRLKDTSIGTATDLDGRYSLQIPVGSQILIFSCVGCITQEIKIDPDRTVVDVVLKENVHMLEEVVTMAYGTTAMQSVVTGSVAGIVAINQDRTNDKKSGSTWKRSGLSDNAIRLEVGDNDYLPLEAAQMAVQVDGFRVRVLMDCFFYNDKQNGLEGTFKLRLPTGATPYYFAFGQTTYLDENGDEYNVDDGKLTSRKKLQFPFAKYTSDAFSLKTDDIEDANERSWDDVRKARIVSKQKAAKLYEETVNARIDPALMEWTGADLFTCRVFPLQKDHLHRVVIGYDLNMTEAASFRECVLTIPTVVKDFQLDMDMYASDAMIPTVTPLLASSQSSDRIYVSVKNPSKKAYTIRYNTIAPTLLVDEDEKYFAANYRIELPETLQENIPSDAIFLLDVSLSSQPDKFNVWLKLLEEILSSNKDIIKRFSVVCFNIDTYWWSRSYVRNNYYNLDAFLRYANTLALEGATDLGTALKEASHPAWLKKNAAKHLFVLSDADFNWGEPSMQALKLMVAPGDRVHTYKTGLSGTNAAALDLLSNATRGFAFTVTGEEEAALTAKSFRYRPWKIESIEAENVEDFLVSGQASQLYNGQKLIFGGRNIPEESIRIRLNNGLETRELVFAPSDTIVSNLVSRIYGELALSSLQNYGCQTEEATESYSVHYQMPSSLTSFLMLEHNSDYDDLGMDEDEARYFVNDHTVADVLENLFQHNNIPMGEGKADFIAWLKRLAAEHSTIHFNPDSLFWEYVTSLPDEVFNTKPKLLTFRVKLQEQQTPDELNMLSEDVIKYDDMLPLANDRKSRYGKADALKLFSSVLEKNAGDFTALRDLTFKLMEWGMNDQAYNLMRRIIAVREYEAMAYATAAEALGKAGQTDLALIYYYICMQSEWDSDYGSFRDITALQCLRYLEKHRKETKSPNGQQETAFVNRFYDSMKTYLDDEGLLIDAADIVVIVNWNINNTDIDLHVREPNGEECYYGHRKTRLGGNLTKDVMDGYGPEMYVLKHAEDGQYKILLNYYSDDAARTSSKAKAYVDFYRKWGRPSEKYERKTVVLNTDGEMQEVFTFEVKTTIK